MKQKFKTAVHILFTAVFLGILAVFAYQNAGTLFGLLKSADKSPDNWQQSAASVEATLKEKVKDRDKLIDLYGLSLLVLDRDTVGNFEFIKGSNGIIQRLRPGENEDSQDYLNSLVSLGRYAESIKMPFVYVSQPDRTEGLPSAAPEVWSAYGKRSKRVGKILQEEGIDCLDLEALMDTDAEAPSPEQFWLRTDGHGTTYGEFWEAMKAAEHLSETYGLSFPAYRTVFDLSNYTVKSYDYLGNLARSSGRYFAGMDRFEIYYPNFETSLTLFDPLESVTKTGTFEEVMLNGYEKGNSSEYTFWIINYGHYTVPYYEYLNNLAPEGATDLLVVCDSSFMRGFSYLALACRRLTVVDPRYFEGKEYLANELALDRYDAVIVSGQTINHKFAVQVSLPDLPQAKMITAEEYGGWIADQGISLDIYNDIRLEEGTNIQVDPKTSYVKLGGWAADFCNDAPFKELYLQVGDVLMKCDYGIERTSVVDYFQKDALLKTGFQVTFPAKYLKGGQVTEVSFIGVSADGQALYEPVTYTLGYM